MNAYKIAITIVVILLTLFIIEILFKTYIGVIVVQHAIEKALETSVGM